MSRPSRTTCIKQISNLRNHSKACKTKRLNTRVTENEYSEIVANAKLLGMTSSDYIASATLNNTRNINQYKKRKICRALIETRNYVDSALDLIAGTDSNVVNKKELLSILEQAKKGCDIL